MVKSVGAAGLERIELRRLTERIGKLYSVLHEAAEAEVTPLAGAWTPAVDVCETADAVCIRVEVPGVSASQIRIGLNGDKIRIYGEKKKRSVRQRIISHLCSERNYGRFSRVVPLRWTISIKDTRAELKDGVLLIHLPKIKDRRGSEYRIPITEIET
ncbi:MAG TPA: Hsp20/alpha crystallin family protein [Pyrinomonadaceae bacterium]|jgi:HSP20 family protein|nr:Hsp20/alpha crystallin family protein [Pyrinomonadaceae bacterium]